MPVVPLYDNAKQSPAPLPGVRSSTVVSQELLSTGGREIGAFGQQAGRTADEFMAVQQKLQTQDDADKVFQHIAATNDDYRAFQTDVSTNRLGSKADGVTKDTTQWWGDRLAKGSDGLENNNQRRLYENQMLRLRDSSLDSMASFEQQQKQRSLVESSTAAVSSTLDVAIASGGNPEVLAGARDTILKHAKFIGGMTGMQEVADATAQQQLTKLYSGAIEALVDTNPDAAAAIFAAHGKDIIGPTNTAVKRVLEEGSSRVVAQTFADRVMATGIGEQAAVAAARKQYSGKQEDAVVDAIQKRFAEGEQARSRSQSRANSDVNQMYAKTKNLDAIPTPMLDRMTGEARLALQERAKRDARGETTSTDRAAYLELNARVENQTLAKTDLMNYTDKLSDTDFKHFADLQKTPAKAANVVTMNEAIRESYGQQIGDDKPDFTGQQFYDFSRKAEFAIGQEAHALGKTPDQLTDEQRNTILDRMLMKGSVVNRWWDDENVPFFKTMGSEDRARFKANIPPAEIDNIISALKARHREVTDEAVIDLYIATQRRTQP